MVKGGNLLSYVFVSMVVISFVCSVFMGTTHELSQSVVDGCEQSITLVISLLGMMCLWSGIMQIAKESMLQQKIAKFLSPVLRLLFKNLRKDSKAFEYMCMNISANMLGLGNAATPLGLKAMSALKSEGGCGDMASDSMITFVVINTASIQHTPTTVCAMRAASGSNEPFDIIFCVWIVSSFALLCGR